MNKFIKLTEKHTNGASFPIIVNTEHILTIKPSERSKDTHIYFKDMKYVFVSETIDEVWLMLTVDNIKAPVIMTAEEYKLIGPRIINDRT